MPSIQFSIEGRSKIHPTGRPPLRAFALQFYRFAVVATIAWLIRDVAVRQRIQGDSPLTAAEITSLLPGAATLRPDDSARDGLFVLDREGRELGYVVRTQPRAAISSAMLAPPMPSSSSTAIGKSSG
jgi:hypothetical protein